jgi:hypothetical protein
MMQKYNTGILRLRTYGTLSIWLILGYQHIVPTGRYTRIEINTNRSSN